MEQSSSFGFLSIVLFLPLVWGAVGLLIPTKNTMGQSVLKYWALLGTLVTFFVSLHLYTLYQPHGSEFQLMEKMSWIPAFGVSYALGLDGISLWLVLLTTFLMPLVVLGSFTAVEERLREYYFLLLALETGMLGAFFALDAFLFYLFWEAMLVPMYLLVGIWGGKDRIYAAMKLFIYTMVGSLLMLVCIFYLAREHQNQFGTVSTLLTDFYKLRLGSDGATSAQSLLFLGFALAFAIKVPMFPLHTWLPDAHVQAPTAGSVVLAGVLLKMGGYGFLRFAFPLFPQAVQAYQMIFIALGAIAIIYGALVCMIQPDIKKLVAYSSVSHMGYVILGMFSLNIIGNTGAYFQMLNHGISTGALFFLVGMIYERRHTREISDFGGITKVMPVFAVAFLIVTLSSVALPGTNGFVGEFLILLGSWKANKLCTVLAGTGVILGAVYMLWMFQRVMFGKINNEENKHLKDLNFREMAVLAPLIIAIFVMGVQPSGILKSIQPSLDRVMARVNAKTQGDSQTGAISWNR